MPNTWLDHSIKWLIRLHLVENRFTLMGTQGFLRQANLVIELRSFKTYKIYGPDEKVVIFNQQEDYVLIQ